MGAPLGPSERGAGGEGGGGGRKRRRRRRRELPPHMAAGERAEGALAGLCRGEPGRGAPRGPSWASGERRHPWPGLAAAAAAVAAPHVGGFPRMHLPAPPHLRPAASPRLPSAPRARGSRARDRLLVRCCRRRRLWKPSPGGEGLRPARPRPAPGIVGAAASRSPRAADFPPPAAPGEAVGARRASRGKGPRLPGVLREGGGN